MKIGSREYKEWLESPLTKALKSSFEQSVTDPENQPSQYGTVTLAMYELVCKQRDLAVEAMEKAASVMWKSNDNLDIHATEIEAAISTIKESEAK